MNIRFQTAVIVTALIASAVLFFYSEQSSFIQEAKNPSAKKATESWTTVHHNDGYTLNFPEDFSIRNNILDEETFHYMLFEPTTHTKMLHVHTEPGSVSKKYVEEVAGNNEACGATPVKTYYTDNVTYYGFSTVGCYRAHELSEGNGWLFNENCDTLDCERSVTRMHVFIPLSETVAYHLEFDSAYPDIERTLRHFKNAVNNERPY